jgi:hypothetical protein
MGSGPGSSTGGGVFEGSIGHLPLVDLLQVWSMNRFSGLVKVTSQGRPGHLYFVDGEILHAEAAGAEGEPAVRVILGWPDGSFEPFPNTTTLKRTIEKRVSHLLLDAHRELDERRRQPAPARPTGATAAPAAREAGAPSVLDQIRAVPGVTQLVRFGGDGRPYGEQGGGEEALAARGLYLALTHAAAVAGAFGLRDLGVAALQGARESFVLFQSRGTYLCLSVEAGVPVEPVAARVRAMLTRPGNRSP